MTDSSNVVDLNTCDLEPIHIPGRIQPFGCILAGRTNDARILYCSENVQDVIGLTPEDLLGQGFDNLLGSEATNDLRNQLSLPSAHSQRARVGIYDVQGRRLEVYAHLNADGLAIIEFEPDRAAQDSPEIAPIDTVRGLLSQAGLAEDIQEILELSVKGLKDLTGYDRVMAYRYEENGDGEVVAEAVSDGVDSFLGLRYPAWDVPKQARALQVKNPLRMLSDIRQDPVPLLAATPDLPDLDMSLAHLRGISPIHVEYLANMGVGASLTLGLVVDEELWGMFSCHHNSPRVVSSDLRIAVELYAQMVSLILRQKQDVELTRRKQQAGLARSNVLSMLDGQEDFAAQFDLIAPELAKIVPCEGLAITYNDKVYPYGETPSEAIMRAVFDLEPDKTDAILPLDNLSQAVTDQDAELGNTAGSLLVRATAGLPIQLAYFRNETVLELNWAGKPEKEIEAGPLGPRITPRGSFEAYVEQQRGFCAPWTPGDLISAEDVALLLIQVAARGERVQLLRQVDLAKHSRQQKLMIAELNHRVKNILTLIRSLSRRARGAATSLEDYAETLEQRITALATAHDLAVSNAASAVSLKQILDLELAPYQEDGAAQVLLSGADIGLRPDVAPLIALVLHEVVSNAVKYGALSSEDGIVRIRWAADDTGLSFQWQELGGPEVAMPNERGFGLSLIEQAIPYEIGGTSDLSFLDTGVRFTFTLPHEMLADPGSADAAAPIIPSARIEMVSSVSRALLVEDNVVIAMDMVDALTGLGVSRVNTAPSMNRALEFLESERFELAILDLNLRGVVSFKIAEEVASRNIPFFFVTGYGGTIETPAEFADVPILTKPVSDSALSQTIRQVLKQRSTQAG